MFDVFGNRRPATPGRPRFEPLSLETEPAQGFEAVGATELRLFDSLAVNAEGGVVHVEGNRKWMAILAPQRQRETRGVGKPRRRAVQHLADQSQRRQSSGPHPRYRQQTFEGGVAGPPELRLVGCRRKHAMQSSLNDVFGANVVMMRHE